MTRSGNLRYRVDLQTVIKSRDSEGGVSEAWQTTAQAWVDLEPANSAESFIAQSVQAEATHLCVMRYRKGITTSWRMRRIDDQGNERIYNVLEVPRDMTGKRRELQFAVKEKR